MASAEVVRPLWSAPVIQGFNERDLCSEFSSDLVESHAANNRLNIVDFFILTCTGLGCHCNDNYA